VVDAFNRTHDRIQIDFQQTPSRGKGGYAKLSNAARAGNAPDAATIEYPLVPGFAIDGLARGVTALVSDTLRAELLPQALGLTTFQGRVFSVPLGVEPMVMHYREDLFERYGLQVPRTRDEFADLARTVRRTAPGRRLALFPTDGATSSCTTRTSPTPTPPDSASSASSWSRLPAPRTTRKAGIQA
jgi:multiple sugar transport system substrate-binding protein